MRSILLFLVGAALSAAAGSFLNGRVPTDAAQVADIQQGIFKLEERTGALVDQLAQDPHSMAHLRELWPEENIGLVIYNDSKAVEWTTKLLPFPIAFGPRDSVADGLVQLRNGWYICSAKKHDGQLLAAFALVHTDHGFENRYVSNRWNIGMKVAAGHRITRSDTETHPLYLADGKQTAHLRLAPNAANTTAPSAIFWLLSLALLVLALWKMTDRLEQRTGAPKALGALALALILMRSLMLWTKAPEALYAMELFGPGQYASSWLLPSLGDLLLHIACLTVVAFRLQRISLGKKNSGPWARWLLPLVAHLLVWPVHFLLHTLVVDAAFPLDLNMPFSLTWYSIIGLIVSFLVLMCHYLTLVWLMRAMVPKGGAWKGLVVPFLVAWAISAGLSFGNVHLLAVAGVSGLVVVFMVAIRVGGGSLRGLSFFTPVVVVYSLFATVVLQSELYTNEHDNRERLARRLTIQQDPITEYLYDELEEAILNDRGLRNALALLPDRGEQSIALINRRLRFDNWNRYRASIHLFDTTGQLLTTDQAGMAMTFDTLQQQFAASHPTLSGNLRFTGNWESEAAYLARITFEGRRTQPDLVLFLRLVPQGQNDILGFTDLFIDEGVSITRDLEGYSFARYQNGELRDQMGEFQYGLKADAFAEVTGEFGCAVADGADHLVHRPFNGTMVVVSRPVQSVLSHFTIFSYLFLFYFGGMLLLVMAEGSMLTAFLAHRSFRTRINLAMAGLMSVSLLVIGLMTVYYVVHGYQQRNRTLISEKSRSVLIELEQKLGDQKALVRSDREMLFPLLSKFSKVFFTDINLYGLDGMLLSSSRPRVFREGLMAQVMDPVALDEMRTRHRSSFIHTENIGKLEYQTAYVPFRNNRNEIIAYLGVPYFARQYGMQQEVISLLAALINIYVFLILIAVVVALLISNRITEPLRIIRDSLRNLRLDTGNRAIEWNSKDEIGELVDEYNRTLSELVRSAELLARSERESAWREMAKQVAHEIKNPLTPMKLNIQMLERSYRDGAPDMGERIERMSRTLIEQIDALSNIASEFSSFAQMPRPVMERMDLHELLENVASLHKDTDMRLTISVKAENPPYYVLADKEQMLRVFNNLVKNAMQAIPEDREGRITLGLTRDMEQWVAYVQDNGTGIPEDLRDRVFVPNFTTKSAGMGLGLAMVQRIVESAEGRIWFETETGVGTTFYVALPMVE